MRLVAALAIGSISGLALAIIPSYGEDTTFTGVGQLSGASCVAVGSNWVMTARHVGGLSVAINGISATAVQRYDHGEADISLLRFTGNPFAGNFYGLNFESVLGQTVTLVGYGGTGTAGSTGVNITGNGGIRRAAQNVVDRSMTGITFDNVDFFDSWEIDLDGPTGAGSLGAGAVANEGSLWFGDSGGAWLDASRRLVAINSYIDDNPNAINGSFSDYGDLGGGVRLQNYRGWIETTMAVPEPASLLALGLPLLAVARRRRR